MNSGRPAIRAGAAGVALAAFSLMFVLLLLVSCVVEAAADALSVDSVAVDSSLGKRLYREGILASGEPLRGLVEHDVFVDGRQLSCGNCHRYSALGTSEGSNFVPALTPSSLFMPRSRVLRQAYRSKAGSGHERPAYTAETLAAAIRTGIDPSGRELDRMMPRYQIDADSMAALTAYLETISTEDAPGVDDTSLHLATIVTEGVSEEDRRSMLDVLEMYVEVKNRPTRNEVRNSEKAPFYRKLPHQAYRKWRLHVWELSGPPATWGRQLAELYAREPVFAVLNGIAAGSWAPIHEFCAETEVPCLFPHTDQPVTDRQDFYSLYLSGGLDLEARVLARHLRDTDVPRDARIVQVWERNGAGEVPARSLREALESAGWSGIEDHVLAADAGESTLSDAVLQEILSVGSPAVLVQWIENPNLEGLAALPEEDRAKMSVFLSSSLSGHDFEVPGALERHVRLVHPFDDPKNESRLLARLNNWLKSRDLPRRNQRIQADAYFAVMFLGRGMKHISQNFSREYLIETLEHALDNATFFSLYPRVSLGPGQRFASKGAFILGLSEDKNPEWRPMSDWIIP